MTGNHDDPGPYWDWDYYYALLSWDGQSWEGYPARAVAMTSDMDGPPLGWEVHSRVDVLNGGQPIPDAKCATRNHSYSDNYWSAWPAAAGTPADFRLIVNDPGLYSVSLWWPNVEDANPAVPVDIEIPFILSQSVEVNQRPNYGQWNYTGITLSIWNPSTEVIVRIRQDSYAAGWILADAVRLLRIGSL